MRIVISGCSSGGKSSLLAELAGRGYRTVEEPGRRIVRAGQALPWQNMEAFLRAALALAAEDMGHGRGEDGPVFFDRGLVDAASALAALSGGDPADLLAPYERYHPLAFLAPPWPDIYETDAERRHGFEEAVAEFDRLARDYPALGYHAVLLPKVSVAARADFVLSALGLPGHAAG
ncbi:MAG: AAA family ATPase [Hyphomonas sp.]|nr:AAA family ATPase [Hyphomonas sp.]